MQHGMGPGNRLEAGAAILAAAQVVDTAPIKLRLAAFLAAHRSYIGAQGKVDSAAADARAAQAKVARREADVHAAVEALALALINDGQPRTKPFAAFGSLTPSLAKHLTGRDKTKGIHQLVAAVERNKTVSQKARDAAHATEQAVRALEGALLPLGQLAANLREARCQRDTIGRKWDIALAALRRETRSAADDGAPGLYPALFGTARTRKRVKPTPEPDPAPGPTDSPAVTT